MHVTLVLGTARKDRKSKRVFLALSDHFSKKEEVTLETVDVRDHVTLPETIPGWGQKGADQTPTKWKKIIDHTDVVVFIIPEYNRSFPGEWKMLVDSLYSEYTLKRVYTVGVSDGLFAGVRVVEDVKPILIELNFHVMKENLCIGNVDEVIDEKGEITDEQTKKRIQKFIDQVVKGA